jgi:hypothetical protein
LQATSPHWLEGLKNYIPDALWKMDAAASSQHKTPTCPRKFAAKKDDTDSYDAITATGIQILPGGTPCLQLKCPDWKALAYTDGSIQHS